MSKRTLRRAAERATQKFNRQNQLANLIAPVAAVTATAPKTQTATASGKIERPCSYDPTYIFRDDPDPEELLAQNLFLKSTTETPISENRLAANRANAQKSTGPVTEEGRATSSLNALKHGLTGNTILLDSDDVEAYQQRLDAHVEQWHPETFEERRLVQSIHDSAWRLDRILNLESTIYAKGRIELQFLFQEIPADQRKSFVELEISQRSSKDLRNLHIQEHRLQRQRAKDIATLTQLLDDRYAAEQLVEENKALEAAGEKGSRLLDGFEFSTSKIGPHQPETLAPDPRDLAA